MHVCVWYLSATSTNWHEEKELSIFMAMIDGTALNVIIEKYKKNFNMKALFESHSRNNHEYVFYDNANVSTT